MKVNKIVKQTIEKMKGPQKLYLKNLIFGVSITKYSFEFIKLKIVREYLNGKGGYKFLSKNMVVPNH